jgi:hypothetical protein
MLPHIITKFGMYVVTPEPITTTHFINPSHQSVCLYVYSLSLLGNGSVKKNLLIFTRQRFGKKNEYTDATGEKLLDASFCMRSVSYKGKYFPELLLILVFYMSGTLQYNV